MARKKIPENYEKMRQGIITAAIELMVKGSITDFSLTDVAEKVGLSKAALYWYFPNKNALIDQVVQNIYDTYIGYIEKISSSDLSSYEKLRRIVLGEEDTLQAALMCVFPIKFYLDSYSESHAVKTLVKNGYEKYNSLITACWKKAFTAASSIPTYPPGSCPNSSQEPSTAWPFRIS